MSVASFNRTLDQELAAIARGASYECLVCGEFLLRRPAAHACLECGTLLCDGLQIPAGPAPERPRKGACLRIVEGRRDLAEWHLGVLQQLTRKFEPDLVRELEAVPRGRRAA